MQQRRLERTQKISLVVTGSSGEGSDKFLVGDLLNSTISVRELID